MAKRGSTPAQILRDISTEVRRLSATRVDKLTGEYSKAQERAIYAAIKRLDKGIEQLKGMIHPWEFGRRPRNPR